MICIKCHADIPDGSLYCNHCGKKQTATPKPRTHKRLSGSGTISRDKRYKNQWIAHAPATSHGIGRKYLGAYATRAEAQAAIDDYMERGRPDLYNATLQQLYDLWSAQHYKTISTQQVRTYRSMWCRFADIADVKISDLRTADFQKVVDTATSASAASKIQSISSALCRCALENDVIVKDYSQFVKMPHFDRKEKKPFSKSDISKLWQHSDDPNVQAVLIMIYTGFRIGEIVTLNKSDIHLDDGYMIGGEKTDAGAKPCCAIAAEHPGDIRLYSRTASAHGQRAAISAIIKVLSGKRFLCRVDYSRDHREIHTAQHPAHIRITIIRIGDAARKPAKNHRSRRLFYNGKYLRPPRH